MSHFTPTDFRKAHDLFGAMCGHGALASALGVPVMLAVPLFDKTGWINIPMMKQAIASAERSIEGRSTDIPMEGPAVAMVQWLGPWMEAKSLYAKCAYRHWIGIDHGEIWDVNYEHWMPPAIWTTRARAELYPPKATGHEFQVFLLSKEVQP